MAAPAAALVALAAYPELKNVILVDEDVDVFDSDDVCGRCRPGCRATWTSSTSRGGRARSRPVADTAVQPAAAGGRRDEQDHLRLHGAVPPARRVRARPVPGRRPDTLALTRSLHTDPSGGCVGRDVYEAPAVASKMLVAAMGLIETLDVNQRASSGAAAGPPSPAGLGHHPPPGGHRVVAARLLAQPADPGVGPDRRGAAPARTFTQTTLVPQLEHVLRDYEADFLGRGHRGVAGRSTTTSPSSARVSRTPWPSASTATTWAST